MDKINIVNDLAIQFQQTKNDMVFTKLYNHLYLILASKFMANEAFNSMPETYDDIFQLTMLKLHTNIDKFDNNISNIVTFAYVIFRNILIDKLRKKRIFTISIDSIVY